MDTLRLTHPDGTPTFYVSGMDTGLVQLSRTARFGPAQAMVRVRGDLPRLRALFDRLGWGVALHKAAGPPVFHGLVWAVTVYHGQMAETRTLRGLANRVRVRFSPVGPLLAREAATATDWAEDTGSIARYGVHELQASLAEASVEAAEALRDRLLAERATPPREVRQLRAAVAAPYAELDCRGWQHALSQRYVEATDGVEGGLFAVTDETTPGWQPVGRARTASTLWFTGDANLDGVSDDPGLRDDAFSLALRVGERIVVSGSVLSDGLWQVAAAGAGDWVRLYDPAGQRSIVPTTPGASVTYWPEGVALAQPIAVLAEAPALYPAEAQVLMYRAGELADDVTVRLCPVVDGEPDHANPLASATLAGTAISERPLLHRFVLAPLVALTPGGSYALVVGRSGPGDFSSYPVVGLDARPDAELGPGCWLQEAVTGKWTRRSASLGRADLRFRLVCQTTTAAQIVRVLAQCGVTTTVNAGPPGPLRSPWRDGSGRALDDLAALLDSHGDALQVRIDAGRRALLLPKPIAPERGQAPYALDGRGRLCLQPGRRPLAAVEWPAGVWTDVSEGEPVFIARVEVDDDDARLFAQ